MLLRRRKSAAPMRRCFDIFGAGWRQELGNTPSFSSHLAISGFNLGNFTRDSPPRAGWHGPCLPDVGGRSSVGVIRGDCVVRQGNWGTSDENRDGDHKAVQAGRGARRADRDRRARHDGDGSQGLWPPEGPYGDLPRRGIRRELSAQTEDRGGGRRRDLSTRRSRRSPPLRAPARSATARSSSARSIRQSASAPANATPTRSDLPTSRSGEDNEYSFHLPPIRA